MQSYHFNKETFKLVSMHNYLYEKVLREFGPRFPSFRVHNTSQDKL